MKLFFFLNLCSIVAVFGYVRLFKGAFHLEKKTEISVGAKVEFPIGKKFVPFGRKPGTSRCQTIPFSEYEPLNKYCFYLLLVTYQLIQGQGTRGAKVPPLWGQQKNIPCIDA